MEIYGKSYSVKELRKRIGNPDQIAGIRTVQLDDGNERPSRAALIHTGSGLELTVLLDRCLDIPAASFCGKPMGWWSITGDVGPQYYEAEWLRWLRSFSGGLLTTCGLMYVGAPTEAGALNGTGLHGRIGNLPAKNIQVRQEWQGNDYVMSVTGTMREAVVFGENLTVTRTVSTKLGERRFWIDDVITNEGFDRTKFQMLYHCNIGWPAVDAGSIVLTPSRSVAPRTADAADGQRNWWKLDPPTHGYGEKVYYHDTVAARIGWVTCAIVNEALRNGDADGFGVYVKYRKKELPNFVQWKMMGEQEYVVGLEPGNCTCEGRHVDEKRGVIQALRPGQSTTHRLEFGPITTAAEFRAIRAARNKVKTKIVDSYEEFFKKA